MNVPDTMLRSEACTANNRNQSSDNVTETTEEIAQHSLTTCSIVFKHFAQSTV